MWAIKWTCTLIKILKFKSTDNMWLMCNKVFCYKSVTFDHWFNCSFDKELKEKLSQDNPFSSHVLNVLSKNMVITTQQTLILMMRLISMIGAAFPKCKLWQLTSTAKLFLESWQKGNIFLVTQSALSSWNYCWNMYHFS